MNAAGGATFRGGKGAGRAGRGWHCTSVFRALPEVERIHNSGGSKTRRLRLPADDGSFVLRLRDINDRELASFPGSVHECLLIVLSVIIFSNRFIVDFV